VIRVKSAALARPPLVALLAAAALSCGGRADASPGFAERDSAGVRIVTSTAPAEHWVLDRAPLLSLGEGVEEGPTSFFRVAAITFLPNERFAVANAGTEQLRIFTTRGDLIAEVGGRGNGPEQFSGLTWLAVHGDSIYSYDDRNDRIAVRDATGKLARTFRLQWVFGGLQPALVLRDGTILAFAARRLGELPGTGIVLDSALVSRYDLTGALLDSIGRFPHNQRVVYEHGNGQTVLSLPFSAFAAFADTPSGSCTEFGTVPEVRCFRTDGTTSLLIRTTARPRPVQQADRDAYFEEEAHASNPVRAQIVRRMRDQLIYPDTLPAFADMIGDGAGRVWVEIYPTTGASTVTWQVFDGGRWAGALDVPAAFRIMAVSGDRVLGVWENELGVESLRMYRFRKD
jgi:hypothetical protein